MNAKGTFQISADFEPPYDTVDGVSLSRAHFEKQFEGGLVATSRVEMLSARTAVEGSAGYVALERVNGTLDGRSGTFLLQHSGTMQRGTSSLSVTVVPDSGTGDLEGLSGRMTIQLVDRTHYYELEYEFSTHT